MSTYGGRRATNFAQYLEDLNTIPSPYEQSVQQQHAEPFDLDAELALFTNTEFLDFGQFGDMNMPLGFSPAAEEETKEEKQVENPTNVDYLELLNDLGNIPDYTTTTFAPEETNNNHTHFHQMNTTYHPLPAVRNNITPQQPAQPNNNLQQQQQQQQKICLPKTEIQSPTTISPSTTPFVSTPIQLAGTKRKQPQDAKSLDEAARAAAEEDKRRRNTAASARFRVKKKQREQALEKSVKEASEKNAALEARVSQLELENQWLKNLITEKNSSEFGEGGGAGKQRSETDIAHMFKNFLASQKAGGGKEQQQSLSIETKSGVGTA